MSARSSAQPPTSRAQGGMTLIEVLVGTVVLVIALLGHMASTFSEYRLAREEQSRSEVLHVARQLVERLRSDEDWSSLYARLRVLQAMSDKSGLSGERLEDGRFAWPTRFYYQDLVLPEWLSGLRVLIDVPHDPDHALLLREDLEEPAYGLPADLNGDGTIDGASRVGDYRALPVVITLRWRPNGETAHQLRLSTWLRGSR